MALSSAGTRPFHNLSNIPDCASSICRCRNRTIQSSAKGNRSTENEVLHWRPSLTRCFTMTPLTRARSFPDPFQVLEDPALACACQ